MPPRRKEPALSLPKGQPPAPGPVLGRESLLPLLRAQPPLVEGMASSQKQVQPNGIDLTFREVYALGGAGRLGTGDEDRALSPLKPFPFDAEGWVELPPGTYLVTFNEVVHLPRDIMALGRTRSSLLRCGVALHTAVWDAGYSGRSQSLMVVYNKDGFRLERNARILQLVFLRLAQEVAQGYQGLFQGENL